MSRQSGLEVPQKQALRFRRSHSDTVPIRQRLTTDRSSRPGERRSPRSASPSGPVNQKKLGTRITDLESQLVQAQEELKILKHHLVSAATAKTKAREESEKKTKTLAPSDQGRVSQESRSAADFQEPEKTNGNVSGDGLAEDHKHETDVYEVLPGQKAIDSPVKPEEVSFHNSDLKKEDINTFNAKLDANNRELEILSQENEVLRNSLNEKASNLLHAKTNEEEMTQRLGKLREELDLSNKNADQLRERLEAVEGVKESLLEEMKKLRVQSEQWRKAADAAASVLAREAGMEGRVSERYGSMAKELGGLLFEAHVDKYTAFPGSPEVAGDLGNGFGNGKHKGPGIKVFGDLWRKKGHK